MRFAGVSGISVKPDEVPDMSEVGPTVMLVRELAGSGYQFSGDIGAELYTGIFLLGYVIPHQVEASSHKWVEDAKILWSSWISQGGDKQQDMRDVVSSLVKEKLKGIVLGEEVETR